MATTTVRVDVATHEKLVALGAESGASLLDTVRDAAEALRRQRLGAQVAAEFAALRQDPGAWNDYLTEGEATNVPDGIG